MNKNQLKQKHKEIIQELEEPELMAYLDNISRNKIDNLSFFTDSVNKLTESVEVEVPSYDFKNFKLIEPEGVVESGS